jgi:glycosyltransferase involved in cell wall biosynthesis
MLQEARAGSPAGEFSRSLSLYDLWRRQLEMKVVHGPGYSPFNPYLFSLTAALARMGVSAPLWFLDNGAPSVPSPGEFGTPDILHLHWLHRLQASTPAPRLAQQLLRWKQHGVRIVWTVHNLVGHESLAPEAELGFNSWFAREVCDEIIVHSESAGRRMISAYQLTSPAADRTTVIPHPSFENDYPANVGRDRARERLGLTSKDRVLLFLGAVRPYKGVERALRAFRRINGKRLRFIVAGQPTGEAIADRVAEISRSDDRVTAVLELIPPEEIQIYMAASDVVVLPYVKLLTSGSMMLAISFGKPVVVPDMDVIREIVDERGAILFDSNSEASLVRALEKASRLDRKTLARMGRNNYQIARRYTWEGAAELTHAAYRRVMARQPESGPLPHLARPLTA